MDFFRGVMKMKIPSGGGLGNGYYNHDVSIISYLSDSDLSDDFDSPTLDGDFSEYMWMENEEEFDQQVMKQLEEEALMEQCIEAMLEEEPDVYNNLQNQVSSTLLPNVTISCQTWNTENLSGSNIVQSMGSLCLKDDLAKQVKLLFLQYSFKIKKLKISFNEEYCICYQNICFFFRAHLIQMPENLFLSKEPHKQ